MIRRAADHGGGVSAARRGAAGAVVGPAEAVRGFLDALGVPAPRVPIGLAAQTALYRSLVAGRQLLVILDNARDAAQVRGLLPGSATCATVVTSRNQLTGLVALDGARAVTLDLFTAAEAGAFLTRRLGPDRVAGEPAAVGEIAAHCAVAAGAPSTAASRRRTSGRCSPGRTTRSPPPPRACSGSPGCIPAPS